MQPGARRRVSFKEPSYLPVSSPRRSTFMHSLDWAVSSSSPLHVLRVEQYIHDCSTAGYSTINRDKFKKLLGYKQKMVYLSPGYLCNLAYVYTYLFPGFIFIILFNKLIIFTADYFQRFVNHLIIYFRECNWIF